MEPVYAPSPRLHNFLINYCGCPAEKWLYTLDEALFGFACYLTINRQRFRQNVVDVDTDPIGIVFGVSTLRLTDIGRLVLRLLIPYGVRLRRPFTHDESDESDGEYDAESDDGCDGVEWYYDDNNGDDEGYKTDE